MGAGMKISSTPLKDAYVIKAEPFQDERGKFARFFCQDELRQIHQEKCITQINYSVTVKKGTIRGMHFQYPPKAEVKLVRCLRGRVFDVIVDLRKSSATFFQWYGEELSGKNMKMLYVPEGFAHKSHNASVLIIRRGATSALRKCWSNSNQ